MTASDDKIEQLRRVLQESSRIVFFGGAGVSTESGIPDFRSEVSRETTLATFGLPPETILSSDFFWSDPATFYRYVREYLYRPDAAPNDAHVCLAKLEAQGKLVAVITQNIDGLHQAAGSERVFEVHGSLATLRCVTCGRTLPLDEGLAQLAGGNPVPHCSCGGMLKPDVVLYQEPLPQNEFEGSAAAVNTADTLIVAGTSLAVYPAAALIDGFTGKNLVVINLSPTSADSQADILIQAPIGEVLMQALSEEPT